MTEDQVRHMVSRFLAWKLPEDFHPDGGITFVQPNFNGKPYAHGPSGTNLLDYSQATAMIEYMLEGLPE